HAGADERVNDIAARRIGAGAHRFGFDEVLSGLGIVASCPRAQAELDGLALSVGDSGIAAEQATAALLLQQLVERAFDLVDTGVLLLLKRADGLALTLDQRLDLFKRTHVLTLSRLRFAVIDSMEPRRRRNPSGPMEQLDRAPSAAVLRLRRCVVRL